MGPIAHAFTLLHRLPRTHTTVICTSQKSHADRSILCAFKSFLFLPSLLCVCVQGVCVSVCIHVWCGCVPLCQCRVKSKLRRTSIKSKKDQKPKPYSDTAMHCNNNQKKVTSQQRLGVVGNRLKKTENRVHQLMLHIPVYMYLYM